MGAQDGPFQTFGNHETLVFHCHEWIEIIESLYQTIAFMEKKKKDDMCLDDLVQKYILAFEPIQVVVGENVLAPDGPE